MKKLFQTLLVVGTLMCSQVYCIGNFNQIYYNLPEGTKWKESHKAQTDALSLVQYIPENQSVENPQDVITVMNMKGMPISLTDYYQLFINELKKNAMDKKLSTKVIEQDDHSLLAEWWIDENGPEDQHEWIRIMKDGNDIAILRYTTKRVGDVEKNRKQWEDMLKKASIKPSSEK